MTDAYKRSTLAAREVSKLFIKRRWIQKGLEAYGAEEPGSIYVNYYSHACARERMVLCDPLKLTQWLADNMTRPGAYVNLIKILDRKFESSNTTHKP